MSTAAAAIPRGAQMPSRTVIGLLFLGVIAVLFVLFQGQDTIPHDNDAAMFHRFNDGREWLDDNRNTNVVLAAIGSLRTLFNVLYGALLAALQAATWIGLAGIVAAIGLYAGGWRLALLATGCVLSFGVLGLWDRSIETIALTGAAVIVALGIGIPIGIAAGRSPRVLRAIQPVLDFMQIMPTFAYLAPLALVFLIGPATAAIATMVYAIAPAIRITALGISGVAPASVEAATSLGSTKRQLLTKVQLPMARRTIILGINQTIMMALAMVVITALVDAPGLGKDLLHALQQNNVGQAFDAGFAVVIMAVLFDRLTTALGDRTAPGAGIGRRDRIAELLDTRAGKAVLIGLPVVAIAAGTALAATTFPDDPRFTFREPINAAVKWVSLNLFAVTDTIKNLATAFLINPIEAFLTESPWWLIIVLVVGVALLISGLRQAVLAAISLGIILLLQMWEHSMATLAQVLVAMALTLGIGLVLGILSARSNRFSRALRPILDGAQTLPAYVYLLPAVALFGPTRFTAIVAALIYAVPPVIRLVEVGLRTVPTAPREAGISAGATRGQLLTKVELPLARPAILVAANQGIIMVLAMVVVGGLVGGGALGYDVVAGFARRDFFGEGLAAALAIVVLGIALDRITQGAGAERRGILDRTGGPGRLVGRFRTI